MGSARSVSVAEVLVVVDMQAAYVAAQDDTLIESIEEEAATVVGQGGRVVAICYDGSGGSTVNLPAGTPTIWKANDCGGDELYAWLIGAGLVSRDLSVRVCGVNLAACVFRTAIGIGERLYGEHALTHHVTIDRELCGDGSKFIVRIV
jgi:hypothetical protein